MNEAIIDKYISNTASEEEIQAVRTYLMEDMERCFLILQKMREKVIRELHIENDPIIASILSSGNKSASTKNLSNKEIWSHLSILTKDLNREMEMKKILSLLLE